MTNSTKWMQKTIALLFLVFLPLVFSTRTIDITLVPQFAALAGLLVASILGLFIFGKIKTIVLPLNAITLCFALFLVFSTTSLWGAINANEGMFNLLKILNLVFISNNHY